MCLGWMFQSLNNSGYPFHYIPNISAPYKVSSWFSSSTLSSFIVIVCAHLSIYWCVMFIFVVNKMCLDWMFQLWISISLLTLHLSSLQCLVVIQLVDIVVIWCHCVLTNPFIDAYWCCKWNVSRLDVPKSRQLWISWFSSSTLSLFIVIVCTHNTYPFIDAYCLLVL